MNIIAIIDSLPLYTQVSVLYTILGSLNTSAINAASRAVLQELRVLQQSNRASIISIDKYNELKNELRQKELDQEWAYSNGADNPESRGIDKTEIADETSTIESIHRHADGTVERETIESYMRIPTKGDLLDSLLALRAPLLTMFNAAQAKLPNRQGEPADFSLEESLARQLAMEYTTQQRTEDEIDRALIASGAVTAEELEAADKKRFEDDQHFKNEFKFLILDKLRDKEPLYADPDTANAAFEALGWEYTARLIKRILPKLIEAKQQQIGRRSFDPDASTNVLILGLAINEFKKFVGDSEADNKLAKLKASLGLTEPTTENAEPAAANAEPAAANAEPTPTITEPPTTRQRNRRRAA